MPRPSQETYGLPHHWTDHRPLLERDDIDMVAIGTPNDTHYPLVLDCAAAGKHVVLEKPMCLSLAEADSMIAACKDAGVLFMYAEEVIFAPKYVRVKSLLDAGALGRPTPHQAVGEARRPACARTSGTWIAPAAVCSRTWAATVSPSPAG